MAPPRLRVLSVGSNAISAFLSWRLQATASCDVTLVWKSGFDAVSQYGVSFKSKLYGNERFKPRHVVRAPEEACSREISYDYVILCVKALPDVYDLAAVIEPVVTPQHTCILVNTTNTLGVEPHIEQRYPTNAILSLVSNVEISQIGVSEFDHLNSTEVWVGYTNDKNSTIPPSIQKDMASAFASTMVSGQADCKVSSNIRQEQFERMIGPIAFHPANVLFNTSDNTQLLQKVGVRQLITDVIDELIEIASAYGCSLAKEFREKVVERMLEYDSQSTMYQDYLGRRPMEVETFLGSPVKLATASDIRVPRLETLYAMLHHVNTVNQGKDAPPPVLAPPPRMPSAPPTQRPPINGPMRPPRAGSTGIMPPPPPSSRRGPPLGPMPRPPPGASGAPGPPRAVATRDPSLDGLEEFSHLVVYGDAADGVSPSANGNGYPPDGPSAAAAADLAYRERELALRQRELQIKEQEIQMRRGGSGGGPGGRRGQPRSKAAFVDEDDGDDFFDPMETPPVPHIDPDSVDMMSITSKRTRKTPSAVQMRRNPELSLNNSRPGSSMSRYLGGGRRRASDRIMQEIPGMHDSLLDNPMMSYSSNRYGAVDRRQLHVESRTNSLTPSRVNDFPPLSHPSVPGQSKPPSRRNSQSPGAPLGPSPGRGMGRPPPPPMPANDASLGPPNGFSRGQPSPPGNMRTPVPRYPSGPGNAVGPQQTEQQSGVSKTPYPVNKGSLNNKSLTGSASASAGSADSWASANHDPQSSGHSSQSNIGGQQQTAMPFR